MVTPSNTMRSERARTGTTIQVAPIKIKANASCCDLRSNAERKVRTLATARYDPGDTRTAAIVDFRWPVSCVSLASAIAESLSNSLLSFIGLRATHRHTPREVPTKSCRARFPVQCNVSQLIER